MLLTFVSGAFAQNRIYMNRHKFYDTTKVENFQKIKRKRLTVDVDTTYGMVIDAWGGECFMNIKLPKALIKRATFYESGNFNGKPYLRYGSNLLRMRMYVNKGGNFEFDAKIRSKLPNGRHEIPFIIQTQGLVFAYQDTLMDSVKSFCFRADSVIGSYAVYHNSKRDNVTYADGYQENYGTGKAFHLYRPKVWDNLGDTTWGTLRIDTTLGRMFIGVDSTWLANAVYPVTIDPDIGITSDGGTDIFVTDGYTKVVMYKINNHIATSGGTLDSVGIWMNAIFSRTGDSLSVAVYRRGSTKTLTTLVDSASWGQTITSGLHLYTASNISGSISTNDTLIVGATLINNNESSNMRNRYDGALGNFGDNIRRTTDTDLLWQANLGSYSITGGRTYSWFASYTVSGGGSTTPPRRRKALLKGE